jgi:4'-phosphopantetheinyl transferase
MTAATPRLADVPAIARAHDAGRIDVWLFDRDVALVDADALDADEEARRARFLTPLLRERFRNGHNTVRALLGAYVGCAPAAVEIVRDGNDKPVVRDARVHFSLSHSDRTAMLAIAREAVGVDCERVAERMDWRAMLPAVAHARECIDAPDAFFRTWTRKEAVMKQLGLGFRLAPSRVEAGTSAALDASWRRARIDGEHGPYVRDLAAPDGFVAALAAGSPLDVRVYGL